jgi:hypothetical protein
MHVWVTNRAMDHDDDVEHLFSWLQTPELRYREFAGAREITDAVVRQVRPNPDDTPAAPRDNVQLAEEYPSDQFPDQRDAPADIVVEQPTAPPTPPPAAAPEYLDGLAGPFALGGRGALRRPHYEEPVVPAPLIQTPAPRQGAAPVPPPPLLASPAPPPQPTAAPSGGGLLGGAYRENELNGHGAEATATQQPRSSIETQQRNERSLDAVFGRLAGASNRTPDPRDRLRHVPGLGPSAGRSR